MGEVEECIAVTPNPSNPERPPLPPAASLRFKPPALSLNPPSSPPGGSTQPLTRINDTLVQLRCTGHTLRLSVPCIFSPAWWWVQL